MSQDLDERILAAEHRLMAREARLRRDWTALGERVTTALQPTRLLAPATGLAVMLLTVRWLRRRPPASDAPSRAGGLPWKRLVGLAWPLLPAHWRAQLPTSLVEAAKLAAPLLAQVFVRRSP